MKFVVTFACDEDGMFVAECPAIPGCVSQGRTQEEAERNVEEAIRECLAVRRDLGMPPYLEVKEVDVAV
ncbi:MAG: type II toxin-antitoxin system HicB family antitoxin [Terriglobales bacterium]